MSHFEQELDRIHQQATRFARRIAYLSGVVFVLLCTITGWALYSRFEQTNTIRSVNAEIWHAFICDIQESVLADPDYSYERKVRFTRFYDNLLVKDAHAAPCNLTLPGR